MNWYLAKIVFQIICGEGDHTPQFDEQLRLIAAPSKEVAFLRAKDVGVAEEEVIENINRKLVTWKFVNIAEIYKIDAWIHGAELYSQIHEAADAEMYIALTNQKAHDIISTHTHELLNLS
jgi:hypothetical protein